MTANSARDFKDKAWLVEERRLLRRIRKGDKQAFGKLYAVMAPALYSRVLMPRLGDPQTAEDVLADTFITGWQRLEQFTQGEVSIYFWLARIASNKTLDLHRHRSRTRRVLANIEKLLLPVAEGPAGPDEALECRTEAEEIRRRIQLAMDGLNPRYRKAVELRFMKNMERAECAAELEVKLGTFDVILLRALRALRKRWSEVQ